MSEIMIKAADGSGSFMAYVAKPEAKGPVPAVVLIQEIFGVNANMRAWADRLAAQGFLAVVPDLFWRQKPGIQLTDKTEAEWQEAMGYMQAFDLDKGLEDIKSTMAWARQAPGTTGKVGAVGFCLGGRLAVLLSTRTDIDASVSYYGVGLEQFIPEFGAIKNPLLVHVAGLDKYATPEARAKFGPAFAAVHHVEYHLYEEADHAFARINGNNYNEAAATLANERTLHFLQHTLR